MVITQMGADNEIIDLEIENNMHEVEIALGKLVKKVKELGETSVYVGVPSDAPANPESGLHPVYYGTIHEYGLHGFPERSFLRAPIADNMSEYTEFMIEQAIDAIEKDETAEKAKGLVGEMVSGDVKKYILDNKVTPSSSSEVTMIDTTHLISNITYRIG